MKKSQADHIQSEGQFLLDSLAARSRKTINLLEVSDPQIRKLFDEALRLTHYAGSCQRVGRCMRLAIMLNNKWAGGIVLGSTFPNIDVRDRSVGLKSFVVNYKSRGLKSAWARENREYWGRLQRIVNHARTFVFPSFQGQGVGTRAHRILLTQGVRLWEQKYGDKVAALDTLCDHGDSKLFLVNGWTHVGETKGYCSNPKANFSRKSNKKHPFKNNVALTLHPSNRKWVVWVKVLDQKLLS